MRSFDYFEPTSVGEAVDLLSRYKGKAKVLAGGTDLLVDLKGGRYGTDHLISLQSIPGLQTIQYDAREGLKLGSMVTMRALELSTEVRERYPAISQAATYFTHVAIRNLATLGGNLCHGVPSADLAPPLIAYSARAKVAGPGGQREVALEEFFLGPRQTVLGADEILLEVEVAVLPANMRSVNFRFSPRATGLPLIVVSVAAEVDFETKVCHEVRVVLGNVAPVVIRAIGAEEIIRGRRVDLELIERTAQAAHEEARPRAGSLRASAWYKKEVVKVFTRQALAEVFSFGSSKGGHGVVA